MSVEHPALSVIIPTHRRGAKLLQCLRALAAQRGAPPFEVLLVFDGPDAEALAAAEELAPSLPYLLRILEQAQAGPATARNRAAAQARGERLLIIGDDIYAGPDLLREHCARAAEAAAEAGDEAAVLGFIDWAPQSRPTRFMRFLAPHNGPQFNFGTIEDPQNLGYGRWFTSNISLPRAWWEREPFDETFPYAAHEDTEWGWRQERRGGRLLYAPRAIAYHDHHQTLRQFIRRQRTAGRAAALLYLKHPELRGESGIFPPIGWHFLSRDGRGWRDRVHQLRILTRHYLGLPVRADDYWWLLLRPYLGALISDLAAAGVRYHRLDEWTI